MTRQPSPERLRAGFVLGIALATLGGPGGWVSAQEPGILSRPETGRQLIARAGCGGCHLIGDPAVSDPSNPGPDLRRVAAKLRPSWAVEMVLAPREVRPTSWMPQLLEEDRDEARAIVAYLWQVSLQIDYPPQPPGDFARGEALFNSVGCTGCHVRETSAGRHAYSEPFRLQGPNLTGLDGKVGAAWLFAWLKNPRQYAPQTRMPDLRLSDQEAADLTTFLLDERAPEQPRTEESVSIGDADAEAGKEAIALYGCYGCHRIAGFEDAGKHAGALTSAEGFSGHGMSGLPDFELSPRETEAIRAALSQRSADEQPALAAGAWLVARYNCRGCHLIGGTGQAIGATLDDVGMLPPNLNGEGSRVNPTWLAAYLDDPSAVRLRSWLTVRMPTFGLSAEQVGIAVAYFAAMEARELAVTPPAPLAESSIALGREVFDLMPCGGCHPLDATAAAAAGLSKDSLGAPLQLARRRLRYEWIPLWLKEPQRWLPGTQMPTFFLRSTDGSYRSPFSGVSDSPALAEPKARMQEHFANELELEAFLNDADAVIEAVRDYVWSLEAQGEKQRE